MLDPKPYVRDNQIVIVRHGQIHVQIQTRRIDKCVVCMLNQKHPFVDFKKMKYAERTSYPK